MLEFLCFLIVAAIGPERHYSAFSVSLLRTRSPGCISRMSEVSMRIQNLFTLGVLMSGATFVGCGSSGGSTVPGSGGNISVGVGGATLGGMPSGGSTGNTTTAPTGGKGNNPTGGNGNNPTGGNGNNPTGGNGNNPTGGKGNTGGNGNNPTGGNGNTVTGGSGNSQTGGSGNSQTGGKAGVGGTSLSVGGSTGGTATSGGTTAGGGSGCTNTDTSKINLDASGFVCNNTLGIKGAWYCYSDGSDSTTSCKGSDGKGAGAIPWNSSSTAMCLSGTMGTGSSSYAGIGFKLNSDPPGSTTTPGSWNASSIVGFAITLTSGASGKGTGGMVLNIEYPTTTDLDPNTKDAPGITIPGVPGTGSITYNALFADSVLANNPNNRKPVDPANLTDVKIAFFPDSVSHTYDFCIKSIVPLTTAPNPVVATGAYGPAWNNNQPQAVNGINGYAVQSAPFPTNGNPMTMQVSATANGVGFTYNTGSGYNAPNNGPGSFPAVVSGWGPGHDGIQFYGPYKTAKQISALTSVKSSWSFTMGSSGNAVYDLWFGNSATPTVPQVELMIWIGNKDKQPLGYGTAAGAALNGRTPYVGTNGTGERVVSYWVATGTNGSPVSDFDVLAYIKDAASKGYAGLSNSSYLLGVQTGFEVYSGNFATTDYNINIQ